MWTCHLDMGVRLSPDPKGLEFTSLKSDLGVGNYTLSVFEPFKPRFKRVTSLKSGKSPKTERVKSLKT